MNTSFTGECLDGEVQEEEGIASFSITIGILLLHARHTCFRVRTNTKCIALVFCAGVASVLTVSFAISSVSS